MIVNDCYQKWGARPHRSQLSTRIAGSHSALVSVHSTIAKVSLAYVATRNGYLTSGQQGKIYEKQMMIAVIGKRFAKIVVDVRCSCLERSEGHPSHLPRQIHRFRRG